MREYTMTEKILGRILARHNLNKLKCRKCIKEIHSGDRVISAVHPYRVMPPRIYHKKCFQKTQVE